MGVEKVFGAWSTPPETGVQDGLSLLWHKLVSHPDAPNFGMTQRRPEITMLWELFRRANPEVILEIGVAQAGTFCGWCQLAREDAIIIAVDRDVNDARPRPGDPVPWICPNPTKYTTQGGGIHYCNKGRQTIHAINGWSYEQKTLDQVMKALNGRKVDFMFCDSSHRADMFEKEFNMYWPLVADGGIYSTHDIQKSTAPDVTKGEYWDWIKNNVQYSALFEFRGPPGSDSMGIGALIP